jgi:hypothetical protein
VGKIELAEEYFQQVQSMVLPNSLEYRAADYRLTFLSLQKGDYWQYMRHYQMTA